jgi:hypothetical protein
MSQQAVRTAPVSPMIATFALLTQTASNLPSDASALERSISALESCVSAFDSKAESLANSSAGWEPWARVFTSVVVIGILMELWVIWDERREDMETWALTFFGVHRTTVRPLTGRLVVECISVVLVAGGIVGELGINIKVASINAQLRAVDAQLRSKNAELRDKSDRLVEILHKQNTELEAKVSWRRLSKEQQSVIAAHLKQFSVIRVGISYLGGNPEASQFADDIAAALQWHKQTLEPFSLFGGFGGGVYPLHPLTGVNVSIMGEKSRNAIEALQRELCSIGFDTTVTSPPPVTRTDGTKPKLDAVVLVMGRPVAPQGATEIAINAKTKACIASE